MVQVVSNRFIQVGDVIFAIDEFSACKIVEKRDEENGTTNYCIYIKLKSNPNWICCRSFKVRPSAKKYFEKIIDVIGSRPWNI